MTRVLPFLKAAIPTLLLALVAPSTVGLKADTSKKASLPDLPSANLLLIARAAGGAKPAIETIPKSQLAWEFDHEPNGTVAIKGPSGTIWQGNLEVSGGPMTPQKALPNYRFYATPNGNGLNRYYQFVPPSTKQMPKQPNILPFLPPAQPQLPNIFPKITP